MTEAIADVGPERYASEVNSPSFVALREGAFDGWIKHPATEFDLDFILGEIFAEQAIQHAREIENPGFVFWVLAAIVRKSFERTIIPAGLEAGFTARLARLAYVGALS